MSLFLLLKMNRKERKIKNRKVLQREKNKNTYNWIKKSSSFSVNNLNVMHSIKVVNFWPGKWYYFANTGHPRQSNVG